MVDAAERQVRTMIASGDSKSVTRSTVATEPAMANPVNCPVVNGVPPPFQFV